MGKIHFTNKLHDWEKTNLVTVTKNGKHYDTYKCKKCGITAKRHGLQTCLENDKTNGGDYIKEISCTGSNKALIGKSIKITQCHAFGAIFANLVPMSVHKVVKEPDGEVNGGTGVWVKGVGVPVLVLWSEFAFIEDEKPKFVRTKKPISRFTRTKK